MAEDDGEERSHEPTDKRKQDAREEGRVLTSKEAMVFGGFAMATGLVMAAAALMPQAVALWRDYLRLDRATGPMQAGAAQVTLDTDQPGA